MLARFSILALIAMLGIGSHLGCNSTSLPARTEAVSDAAKVDPGEARYYESRLARGAYQYEPFLAEYYGESK